MKCAKLIQLIFFFAYQTWRICPVIFSSAVVPSLWCCLCIITQWVVTGYQRVGTVSVAVQNCSVPTTIILSFLSSQQVWMTSLRQCRVAAASILHIDTYVRIKVNSSMKWASRDLSSQYKIIHQCILLKLSFTVGMYAVRSKYKVLVINLVKIS